MQDDPCYELVQDQVSPEDWHIFTKRLPHLFKGIPAGWGLDQATHDRLILKLQWFYFNPDLKESLVEKRGLAWAYVAAFLGQDFNRKFLFLRSRHRGNEQANWDKRFSTFENLLYLSSMDEEMRLDWLSRFDAKGRYGGAHRVKVIKNKGLGVANEVLGVTVLMSWEEIKARYRFLLKRHHPDLGGDPEMVQSVITAFKELSKKTEDGRVTPVKRSSARPIYNRHEW